MGYLVIPVALFVTYLLENLHIEIHPHINLTTADLVRLNQF